MSEMKQILIGIIIFGLIIVWVSKTTNNDVSLSPNMEDKEAQYNQ